MAYSSSRQEDIDLEFWEACRAGDMSTFSRLLQWHLVQVLLVCLTGSELDILLSRLPDVV